MKPTDLVINVDLDIGESLRGFLIHLGWTPPGQMPPKPPIEPHPFVDQQSVGRQGGCLLVVQGGRLCSAKYDDPIHRTES